MFYKNKNFNTGQTMILTVMVLNGVLLSVAIIAALLMSYQVHNAGDFTNTNKAIFAADAGTELWLYNHYHSSSTISSSNITFTNGAKFEITEVNSTQAKIIGQAGNSKRAFLVTAKPVINCKLAPDVMILIDRSPSIVDPGKLDLEKNAVISMIQKLQPSDIGSHIGIVSFAGTASIETHLTGTLSSIEDAVNSISGGEQATNIDDAIFEATDELSNHDRPDSTNPDYILLITDGQPNTYGHNSSVCCRLLTPCCPIEAMNQATQMAIIAKQNGTIIFTVGVGADPDSAAFLRDNIASEANSYVDVNNFSNLTQALEDFISC